MAKIDWEDIYFTYTDEELQAELDFLKEESRSLYISQSQGSKAFSRSLSDLARRLTAATRIQAIRSGKNIGVGKVVVDFT